MPLASPPTVDDLIEVFKRVTPAEYHEPIIADPRGSFALVRGIATMYATLAEKIYRTAQSTFHLPHANQGDQPASSGVRATFLAKVQRTRDLDQARVIPAGGMLIDGPQGRRYENVVEVSWIPFDTEIEKPVAFQSIAPGFIFNLDHIADPDGLITAGVYDAADTNNPNANGPDSAKVFLRPLSGQRTSIGGSIVAATAPATRARLLDSGRPNKFVASDVGLYVRIDASTDPDSVGRVLRITGFEDPQVEDPANSGLFPRRIIVDDGPQRFRLASAQADDGGAFTDQTVAANEESPDDMTLLPAAPVVGDAYYFGGSDPSSFLTLNISTAGVGTWDITWEYFNGATYVALSDVTDNTSAFRSAGRLTVEYTLPGDWVADTINGVSALHVRARLSSFTSLAAQPLGSFAFASIQKQLLVESGTVTWSVLDWIDLGLELTEIPAATGGRDDDLRILGDARGIAQQDAEQDSEFRERLARLAEVVSPDAIRAVINRQLEPFGFIGQAFDVGPEGNEEDGVTPKIFFEGFFADIDAADYYEPGDLFPTSPFKLPLSLGEAYGRFFVRLPFLGFGDFGMFADEGPVFFLDTPGAFLGSAADHGFVDGYAVDANAAYAAIFDAVSRIRGGGIGFTMFRDTALNTPVCP